MRRPARCARRSRDLAAPDDALADPPIANGDLHGRNVSLLVGADGRCRLAPAYDLLSSLPYGDQRLALRTLGRDDNLKRAHFFELGRRYQLQPGPVEAMLDRLCDGVSGVLGSLDEPGFDRRRTEHLRKVMSKRRDELGRRDRSS